MRGRISKVCIMPDVKKLQCSPNCWCKQKKSDEYLYS